MDHTRRSNNTWKSRYRIEFKEITSDEFRKFITSENQGIKIDERCLALGVSFAEIWNEVRNKINRKKYNIDDMNAKCLERLEKARNKLGGTEQKPEVVNVELQEYTAQPF